MVGLADLFKRKIDYAALESLATTSKEHNMVERLERYFRKNGIEDYESLVAFTNERMKKVELSQINGIRDPYCVTGVGTLSLKLLYTHLNQRDILLYEDGYLSTELKDG